MEKYTTRSETSANGDILAAVVWPRARAANSFSPDVVAFRGDVPSGLSGANCSAENNLFSLLSGADRAGFTTGGAEIVSGAGVGEYTTSGTKAGAVVDAAAPDAAKN